MDICKDILNSSLPEKNILLQGPIKPVDDLQKLESHLTIITVKCGLNPLSDPLKPMLNSGPMVIRPYEPLDF